MSVSWPFDLAALGLIRELQLSLRPDLRLIVMSATMDCQAISQYLGGCEIMEIPGLLHPR